MKRSLVWLLFVLSVFTVWQGAVITADPDMRFEIGRGPLTDEGWHSYQLRNYLNGHGMDSRVTDSFLKEPGFNAFLFPWLLLNESPLLQRFAVLALILFSVLLMAGNKGQRLFLAIFVILGLMHPVLFQYAHYSMAEMPVAVLLLLGIWCFCTHWESGNQRMLVAGSAAFFGAFLMKLQYAPELMLVPLYGIIYAVQKRQWRHFRTVISSLAVFIAIYAAFWWLPHREDFSYFIQLWTKDQFLNTADTWERVRYYYREWLAHASFWRGYFEVFCVALTIGLFFLFRKESGTWFRLLFLFSLAVIILQCRVFVTGYVPLRYLVSMLFFGLALISATLANAYQIAKLHRSYTIFLIVLFAGSVWIIWKNLDENIFTTQHLQWQQYAARQYLKQHLRPGERVLGNWAPSLCNGLQQEVRTISYDVAPYRETLLHFRPRLIIAETDEADSDGAFLRKGISLQSIADSSKTFSIGGKTLRCYWLHPASFSLNSFHENE